MKELSALLPGVVDAVRAAGRAIQEVRASGSLDASEKGDQGPVTRADRAADTLLHERLLALEPIGWLSEETADSPDRLGRDALWVVDPLDGTKEFVEGVPQYAVAVGLVVAGEAVLGVVHNPASGALYSAVRGGGAFRDGERVRVAEGDRLLASRSEMKRGEFDPFTGWTLDPVGSIALKLAMIGAGEAAVTLSRGPKWEWDVCAGSVIVREGGGEALDMFGGALRFNQSFPKSKGILAGAPAALARMREQLAAVGPSDRMDEFTS